MRRVLILIVLLVALPLSVFAQGNVSWRLTFYNSLDLSGNVVARADAPNLNFNFTGEGSFLPPGVDINRFSLRAQTQEQFAEGVYEFQAGSDDGVRVYVDGDLIIDSFINRGFTPNENTAQKYLDEGFHTISVEYYQDGGDAQLQVGWARVADAAPPGPQPGPALPGVQVGLGQVVNVEGLSVRSGPYLGATRLDIIEPGTTYPVFARNTQEGIYNWYLIQVQDFIEVFDDVSGQDIRQYIGEPIFGWVSGRYFFVDTPEDQIPLQESVFETLTNPPPTGVTGVTRSNMRLRAGPSYRTSTLEILDWGAEVEIVSRTVQARENHWFQVRYEGRLGWLYAPFIGIAGDIDNVPQY